MTSHSERLDILAEYEREDRDYKEAVSKLNPYQRARWAAVAEANEWFDGEAGIALGYLERWLVKSGGRTQ
jgi:hypothetical protein